MDVNCEGMTYEVLVITSESLSRFSSEQLPYMKNAKELNENKLIILKNVQHINSYRNRAHESTNIGQYFSVDARLKFFDLRFHSSGNNIMYIRLFCSPSIYQYHAV